MAVGYASHGVKLFRPLLVQEAEELYHELLSALAQAIRDPGAIDKEQTVVMAVLLGLYEVCRHRTLSRLVAENAHEKQMIMARDTAPGNHAAHAGGLAALLRIENDPLSLLEAVYSGRSLLPSALRVSDFVEWFSLATNH
jgi:hypothetical protein